jgi:type III pantothenate kinase
MLFSGDPSSSDALLFVIETGNTTTSFAVFRGSELLEVQKRPSETLSGPEDIQRVIAQFLQRYPELSDAALCSVVPSLDRLLLQALTEHLSGRIVEVTSALQLPFTLHYESPEAFGADRIALCALCRTRYPEDAVIALDIGTAITVDVLSSGGSYLGGLIMPGLDLMARSLHEHTARLPLVGIAAPSMLIGNSTAECIQNGIIWGCVSSIEGLLKKIKTMLSEKHDEKSVRVMVTGGSAALLAGLLDTDSHHEDLAVLRGTRFLFSLNA